MDITQIVVVERDRGLLGGDYSTYHAQTTRAIQNIRKRLGVRTPRGKKYTAKAQVTAEEISRSAEWIKLLLMSAERAWADALAMKSIQSPENTQKPMAGSTKRQIVSRYHRALKYAKNLVLALQDQAVPRASDQDVLEAKAYLALLKGGLDFERNRWASCIANYSFVRIVYTAMGTAKNTDIYKDLLEGTIDPSIRYAAYQEKLPRTKAVLDIAIENFPADEVSSKAQITGVNAKAFETTAQAAASQAEGLTDLPTVIEWRGRQVKLEDASISQALAVAQAREKSLDEVYTGHQNQSRSIKELIAAYDNVITAQQDAVDATKIAIDELVAENVDPGDTRIQSLQITRTALNYRVIAFRIGRNRVLIGDGDGLTFESIQLRDKKSKEQETNPALPREEPKTRRIARLRERVGLYESILQSLDVVKHLPGVAADTAFTEEIDQKYGYFRALKCTAIGRSHVVHEDVAKALALFSRAAELSRQSSPSSGTASTGAPRLQISSAQITGLRDHVSGMMLQYQALNVLHRELDAGASATANHMYKPSLLERLHLNRYDDKIDLRNIADYPPKLQTVPMKPIFLDLAWNYLQYPEQAHSHANGSAEVDHTTRPPMADSTAEEAPKKRGWFGFGR